MFLRQLRCFCKTHASWYEAGARDDTDSDDKSPYTLSLPYYRLRDMRYAASFLPELHTQYVDLLEINAVRRYVVERWTNAGITHITNLKRQQARLGLSTAGLQRATRGLLALQDFAPARKQLKQLQLAIFRKVILPRIPAYDRTVAAFDGQIIKVDGTFRLARTIQVPVPCTGNKNAKKYKKVHKSIAGAALVEAQRGCYWPPPSWSPRKTTRP